MELKRSVVVCIASAIGVVMPVLSQTKQEAAMPQVPFRLTSDGHACSGFLRVTEHRVIWKSSFRTCRASGWKTLQKGDAWALQLQQTEAERKACAMEVIELRPEFPETGAPPWEVSGYTTLTGYREDAAHPVLDCPTMDR